VTEVGAGLRSWCVDGVELLDTFAADAPADSYRGKVLAPWPNRVRDGRYAFGGAEHRLALNEPERGAALHGLVLDAPFAVVARATHAVTLGYDTAPAAGYPFALRVEAEYSLGEAGLSFALHATKHRPRPGAVRRRPASVPARPRGRLGPRGPGGDARPGRRPNAALGRAGSPSRARRTTSHAPGASARSASIPASATSRATATAARASASPGPSARSRCGWTSASASSTSTPRRGSTTPRARAAGIAIEPITCAPDAFNSGAGLEVLRARRRGHGPLRAPSTEAVSPPPPFHSEEESCDSSEGPA